MSPFIGSKRRSIARIPVAGKTPLANLQQYNPQLLRLREFSEREK